VRHVKSLLLVTCRGCTTRWHSCRSCCQRAPSRGCRWPSSHQQQQQQRQRQQQQQQLPWSSLAPIDYVASALPVLPMADLLSKMRASTLCSVPAVVMNASCNANEGRGLGSMVLVQCEGAHAVQHQVLDAVQNTKCGINIAEMLLLVCLRGCLPSLAAWLCSTRSSRCNGCRQADRPPVQRLPHVLRCNV
jgi:hypothetical protein